jgi:hypothetical protein
MHIAALSFLEFFVTFKSTSAMPWPLAPSRQSNSVIATVFDFMVLVRYGEVEPFKSLKAGRVICEGIAA